MIKISKMRIQTLEYLEYLEVDGREVFFLNSRFYKISTTGSKFIQFCVSILICFVNFKNAS